MISQIPFPEIGLLKKTNCDEKKQPKMQQWGWNLPPNADTVHRDGQKYIKSPSQFGFPGRLLYQN